MASIAAPANINLRARAEKTEWARAFMLCRNEYRRLRPALTPGWYINARVEKGAQALRRVHLGSEIDHIPGRNGGRGRGRVQRPLDVFLTILGRARHLLPLHIRPKW
eukprot:CAMPEP_0119506670 /NCGR_PEP_ID=MMETSP1344-20130328/26817_1 /TAXON_ID=236787 /ORGANISM="Florenciella parvula, Strain CCMP2471" /LENGTH=106 /DNA_ID=CAMNT_0007543235 /DNA_START=44 /DNA_END=364 /DNA_ORIENTATION=+